MDAKKTILLNLDNHTRLTLTEECLDVVNDLIDPLLSVPFSCVSVLERWSKKYIRSQIPLPVASPSELYQYNVLCRSESWDPPQPVFTRSLWRTSSISCSREARSISPSSRISNTSIPQRYATSLFHHVDIGEPLVDESLLLPASTIRSEPHTDTLCGGAELPSDSPLSGQGVHEVHHCRVWMLFPGRPSIVSESAEECEDGEGGFR